MSLDTTVSCRARVNAMCEHGIARLDWRDDGTFDGQSIVCDHCYVDCIIASPSGRGLNHELPATIARLRAAV